MTEPEALAIVRDLATKDPVMASEVRGDPCCSLCDGWTTEPEMDEDDHADTCPWRRARVLVGDEA